MQALDPNPFECQDAFCVTFHSFGSLLYMDIACALVLLLLAAVLYGRLRRRRDHNYFVIPLGGGLLALVVAYQEWRVYRSWTPYASILPPWSSGAYEANGPWGWWYTPLLLLLTLFLLLGGLIKLLGKEPTWRL